jgi:ankyrin repeat protein
MPSAESHSPLHAVTDAITSNNPTLLRQILTQNPVLRTQLDQPLPNYSFGTPAILAAVSQSNRETINILLDAGANINARSVWWAGSFGVLDIASPELAPFLIERGAAIDVHAAARLGMFDRLKSLVDAEPALVHARGGDGQTPLHFAATVEIARYLLDHGADINATDIDHESTPAQYMAAARPHRHAVARYLIERGAATDILMAAALGDIELVSRHLDANPDSIQISVSEKDFPKRNPESGGSIYIFGFGWTKTSHTLAREFGHDSVLQLLMERSPLPLKLAQACEVHDEALMRKLVTANPEIAQTINPAAIVGAALRNNTQAVSLMLQAGWPVDARGDQNQTPLHWAAFHGNLQMARELVRHKAPVDAREAQYGGTPLDWARHGCEHGWYRHSGDYPQTIQALEGQGDII